MHKPEKHFVLALLNVYGNEVYSLEFSPLSSKSDLKEKAYKSVDEIERNIISGGLYFKHKNKVFNGFKKAVISHIIDVAYLQEDIEFVETY